MGTSNPQIVGRWIQAGLWALPVSWLLTAWSSLEPQPDQTTDPEAWARFVSTDSYQVSHLIGGTGGTILALFGVFALGCFLATSRAGGLALAGLILAAAGNALLLVPAVISTFATPAIGKAYLAGNQAVMQLEFPDTLNWAFLLGLLLAVIGGLVLGLAVWRSHVLPRWAGALWVAGTVLFYVLGAVLGRATTGSSLPTQSAGALVLAVAGGWIAWSAARQIAGTSKPTATGSV
jgi:hypothetical protein